MAAQSLSNMLSMCICLTQEIDVCTGACIVVDNDNVESAFKTREDESNQPTKKTKLHYTS